MNSDILFFWCTSFFHILRIWMGCSLGVPFFFFFCMLWVQTYCTFDSFFFTYSECGYTALLEYFFFSFFHILWMRTYCSFGVLFYLIFLHTMNSNILLFWRTVFLFLHILWIQTYCFFSHIMNFLNILLFWFTVLNILWIWTYYSFGHIISFHWTVLDRPKHWEKDAFKFIQTSVDLA